jgi:class 3 adenylate cyclase
MSLGTDLKETVQRIFRENWETREGKKVPELEDLKLSNDAVELDAVVLYADLAESTKMVDQLSWLKSAEIYKTYLHCASKIIEQAGGIITAFDGDRVMAVFIGDSKCSSAATCALKINYAVQYIVNPSLKSMYTSETHSVWQVVGIDTSILRVARTGVWGSNDLVWVGRAANYAAKLSNLNEAGYFTYITADVYDKLNDGAKMFEGKNMWERRTWPAMGDMAIYRSAWWRRVD